MSIRRQLRRPLFVASGAIAASLALAGCVANNAGGGSALTVDITDDTCTVSESTATAGAVTFTLTNSGSDTNEFEILAEDKLRIVGEKENVTPKQNVSYTLHLEPGIYYTACKFQLVGAPIGLAKFTVTGDSVKADDDEQKLIDEAVTNYVSYVKSQTGELVPAVKNFVDAYVAGNDAQARELFASTRVFYERIEPTAEAFGDLDPKIDYREVDAVAEGLDWTGFHRIEKDLWPPAAGELNSDGTSALLDWAPSTPAERAAFGKGLIDDVDQLYTLVYAKKFTVSLADISNGAIGLLDEVATGKISGEEDWWSHTDLTDFAANVQGAEVAFGNVHDLVKSKGATGTKLATKIQKEFDALNALLAKYGSIETGFTPYDEITDAQRKELSDQVNSLAEPLSKLTSTVLGL
ncbi:MAG TPA: iron uptake system protein EfeO [Pseudolysinimonas sp.]|nr:iron uptake system protein EfeO [Pseudolysinimonas sp.]